MQVWTVACGHTSFTESGRPCGVFRHARTADGGQAPPALLHDGRLEGAGPVPRHLDLHRRQRVQQPIRACQGDPAVAGPTHQPASGSSGSGSFAVLSRQASAMASNPMQLHDDDSSLVGSTIFPFQSAEERAMKGILRQAILVITALILIVTNLLGGGGGSLDGNGSNDMYSKFPTAFSPAPYTFAVWGPIFIGVLAFAIYQVLPSRRRDQRLDALGVPMASAFLACAATAYTTIGISNLVMLVLLASLIWAYLTVVRFEPIDCGFFWNVRVPISVFFAWITVATILNVSQWLVSIGFEGFGVAPELWSALLILLAAGIGFRISTTYRDVAFALVLIWAFWGIVVARPTAVPVLIAAVAGTFLLAGACVWMLRGRTVWPARASAQT